MPDQANHLVTFALFAYNQARFIREAVEGAFSQTYSPLEIILSDDCSTDRTFVIMKEMVAKYQGPHRIVLNRNERNLGIGGHVNRLMEIADGRLIVVAAGDDVSRPDRTAILQDVWTKSSRMAKFLCSGIEMINAQGDPIGNQFVEESISSRKIIDDLKWAFPSVIGCSEAWDRELFTEFGPLSEQVVAEDRVIPFRARVVGVIALIPQLLVKHRLHQENVYDRMETKFDCERSLAWASRILDIHQRTYEQYLVDLANTTSTTRLGEGIAKKAVEVCERRRKEFALKRLFLEGRGRAKLSALMQCLTRPFLPEQAVKFLVRLLLPGLYRHVLRRNWQRTRG